MEQPAATPEPPYYAVIFSATQKDSLEGYSETATRMFELAREQPGYLGVESAHEDKFGITVSYWQDLEAIAAWKQQIEHRQAQARGRESWYRDYVVRICRVERAYGFG